MVHHSTHLDSLLVIRMELKPDSGYSGSFAPGNPSINTVVDQQKDSTSSRDPQQKAPAAQVIVGGDMEE